MSEFNTRSELKIRSIELSKDVLCRWSLQLRMKRPVAMKRQVFELLFGLLLFEKFPHASQQIDCLRFGLNTLVEFSPQLSNDIFFHLSRHHNSSVVRSHRTPTALHQSCHMRFT